MTETLPISIKDNVFLELETTQHQALELSDYFSHYVKNYRFMPKFKFGQWDGKIRFYNRALRQLPIGLLPELLKFCDRYSYVPEFKQNVQDLYTNTISENDLDEFLKTIPLKYTPRDYQVEAFKKLIKNNRGVVQLNTGLGKSLVIYMLVHWLKQFGDVLIIVPSINLVTQLYNDFADYGYENIDSEVSKVYGLSKDTGLKKVVISTWQSQYTKSPDQFTRYNSFIIDETHTCRNTSGTSKTTKKNNEKPTTGAVKEIATMCYNARYRFGLTGTLSDDKCDMMTLRGYIGEVLMETRSSEYIEKGVLSKIKIVNLFCKYPEEICRTIRKAKVQYQDELDYTLGYAKRNDALDFILKCVRPEENVLLLVTKIEKQLKPLEQYIRQKYPNKKLRIIYGKTEGEEREQIRQAMENDSGTILLASYGTLSTGVNIKKIHHIIFYSSYKSKIKVLQSIGRGLRTHSEKEMLITWDVVDDIRVGKFRNNIFKQWEERIKYYQEQGFKTINKVLNI